MNIDWSKAPEGFPLWAEDLFAERGGDESGWCYEDDSTGDFICPDGTYWSTDQEGKDIKVHRKPSWNGEGLPPANIPIEMKHKAANEGWARPDFTPIVLAWVGKKRFMTDDEKVGDLADYLFRPSRTPQQIEAEKRESAIEEMEAIYKANCKGDIASGFAALYDAGFQKQVTNEN